MKSSPFAVPMHMYIINIQKQKSIVFDKCQTAGFPYLDCFYRYLQYAAGYALLIVLG